MSHVTCHMSHVTCNITHVMCHLFLFFLLLLLDKVVKLVNGGSVINRAYPACSTPAITLLLQHSSLQYCRPLLNCNVHQTHRGIPSFLRRELCFRDDHTWACTLWDQNIPNNFLTEVLKVCNFFLLISFIIFRWEPHAELKIKFHPKQLQMTEMWFLWVIEFSWPCLVWYFRIEILNFVLTAINW